MTDQPLDTTPPGARSGFLTMLDGCGIWQLVDVVMIATRKYTDSNGAQPLRDHLRKLAK